MEAAFTCDVYMTTVQLVYYNVHMQKCVNMLENDILIVQFTPFNVNLQCKDHFCFIFVPVK